MIPRRSSSLHKWLLLLILIIGPLQAQTVFACEMMDTIMHGECCCAGDKSGAPCDDADCEGAFDAGSGPCCERSVELSLDPDARQDSPAIKPVEMRSAVDPPPAIIAATIELVPPQSPATIRLDDSLPALLDSRSDTYLLTQRLRI
jgi:hypothetical protein